MASDADAASFDSETPRFDAIFTHYDTGQGTLGTDDLGPLLLAMGFDATPHLLDRALDVMDPNATGEIPKLAFLEWLEEHGDEMEPPVELSLSLSPHGKTNGNSPRRPSRRRRMHSATGGDPVEDGEAEGGLEMLTSAMLDAKRLRKKTDEDVQLLSNRLVHLRKEEQRAQKLMADANRRAKEMEHIRQRNHEHQKAKQRLHHQLQHDMERSCAHNMHQADQSRARRRHVAHAIVAQRAESVQETKLERVVYHERIKQRRQKDERVLQERSKEIRQQERDAVERRAAHAQVYQQELVRQARTNLAEEHKRRLLSERQLRAMEAEEAKLLEKLQIAQELRHAAQEHLAFVQQD